MQRKGEKIILPEMQAVEKPITTAESQKKITPSKGDKASIEQSLHTFRTGTPEEKRKSILTLSQLGEVEKF